MNYNLFIAILLLIIIDKSYQDQQPYIVSINTFTSSEKIKEKLQELNEKSTTIENLQLKFEATKLETIDFSDLKTFPLLKKLRIDVSALYAPSSSLISYSVPLPSNVLGLEIFQYSKQLTSVEINVDTIAFKITHFDFISKLPLLQNLNIFFHVELPYFLSPSFFDFSRTINLESLTIWANYYPGNKIKINNCQELKKLHVILPLEYKLHNLIFIQGLDDLTTLEDVKLSFDESPVEDISYLENLKNNQNLQNIHLWFKKDKIKNFQPLVDGLFPLQNIQDLYINIQDNPQNNNKYGNPQVKKLFDQRFQQKQQIQKYEFISGLSPKKNNIDENIKDETFTKF